ncbi:MAG: hypothetical protein QXK20_02125 [Nitrososphaerales archaeon]
MTIYSGIGLSFLFRRKTVSTALKVYPPNFQVESGRSVTLKAHLNPEKAPVERVEWRLEGLGILSESKGPSTVYTAPNVEQETKVRVVASFPKMSEYLESSSYAEGVILPSGLAAKSSTFLTISPISFSINAGENIDLTAVLTDMQGNLLGSKEIVWFIQPQLGKLTPTSNNTAVYTAPKVDVETQILIKAVFQGDEQHLPCEGVSIGLVTPPTLNDEYILSFSRAEVSNLKIDGGAEVDGVRVVRISVDLLEISDMRISRVNLSSQSGVLQKVEIYATRLTARIPDSDKGLDVKGEDDIHLNASEASLDNGVIYFVKMSCLSGELTQPEVLGRYAGGDEPYLPILLTTSNITMDRGFSVTGPETYGMLENKATKILCGRISASNFFLKCPSRYSLDREGNNHEFVEKWALNASSAAIEDAEIYAIYFKVRALLVWRVKATGEEYIPSIIPEGLHRGEKAPINEADVDIIYLKATKLKVNNASFTLK